MKDKEYRTYNKKGQVTYFLIFGIILLIVILFLIYLNYSSSYSSSKRLTFDKSSIASYIQSCVDKTSLDGLVLVGRQGLYLEPKEFVSNKISFLLRNGKLLLQSKGNIESELSVYVQDNLLNCLENFQAFKSNLWEVFYENPRIEASINLDDVSFSVKFPVNVKREELTISISDFNAKHEIRLFYLYDLINKILDTQLNEHALDLTELTNYNINLTIFPYQDSLIYAIEDTDSLVLGKPYLVMFASD